MKHIFKRIAILISALCLALSFALFAACGDGTTTDNGGSGGDTTDGKVTYTITVTSEQVVFFNESTGIKVQLKKEDGTLAEEKPIQKSVTFSLDAGTYTVTLSDPNGYLSRLHYVYSETTVTENATSATVAIVSVSSQAPKATYTVVLQYPDGTPAANVMVEICGGANGAYSCHPAKTDAQGTVTLELDAGEYEVHVNSCPSGYTFDNTLYKMTAEGGTLTAKLTKAN